MLNRCLDYFIDSSFQAVNRPFLLFENKSDRNVRTGYFFQK